MKRFYALTFFVLSASFMFGQVYLSEDFSSGNMPPAGWSVVGQEAQWSNSNSASAGGIAPEAKFTWKQVTDLSRLISPVVDLTGTSNVKINFKHFLDNYGGGQYSIGCATRSGGSDWNTIWEVFPTTNIGPELKYLDIAVQDEGASDFQFCFFIDGNMYNINYWFIDNVKLLTPNDLDLELTALDIPYYVLKDEVFDVAGTVTNVGLDDIASFDVTYTVDGNNPLTTSYSSLSLAIGDAYDFTCDQPLSFPAEGSYEVQVTISNINGGDDDDNSNDTLSSTVGVVPYIPEKKVIGEEATGTWCGWCVRGICFMDYMAETYPDTWIGIAVHNGDPMVVPEYDAALPNIIPNFPGYPSGTVDRVGMYDPSEFEEGYLERIDAVSPATCEITNFSWDPATREVSFDVESEFVTDVSHELRFMAILVEDSVFGTSSDWNQSNYYAGGGQGEMCGYESLPNPVPASQMKYDHVARAILDTPYGTEGSLPEDILSGETHSYTYTYTIPDEWNYYWMHFVGALIDMGTGEILNANSYPDEVTGIGDQVSTANINIYPNPTTGVLYISGLERAHIAVFNATGIQVAEYTDFAGNSLDISNLPNGMYFINIQTGENTITKKVALNR
jgi:hypothetical protein